MTIVFTDVSQSTQELVVTDVPDLRADQADHRRVAAVVRWLHSSQSRSEESRC